VGGEAERVVRVRPCHIAAASADAGGTVMYGPLDVMGQGRMLVASDPEGAVFGIWQPQAHTGAQLVNENATLTWNERMTRDLDGTKRFYNTVFGPGELRRRDLRAGIGFEGLPEMPDGSYQLLKVGDAIVGGMFRMPDDVPAEAPPHWLAYSGSTTSTPASSGCASSAARSCASRSTRPTGATRRCRIRRPPRSA
jgi:uncharacterized protein